MKKERKKAGIGQVNKTNKMDRINDREKKNGWQSGGGVGGVVERRRQTSK